MKPADRRASYADLLEVPDHMVAEIVDGELYAAPRPALPHATAASSIAGDLNGAFHRPADGPGRPGGWWILVEPELHLGTDVIVPDLAGWRRERIPALRDVAFFDVPPDWVCEVVSPATGALDRARKMPIYAREGVAHLWLVDPISRTLEVYNLDGSRWVVLGTHGGKQTIRAAPFAVVELDIGRWWLD